MFVIDIFQEGKTENSPTKKLMFVRFVMMLFSKKNSFWYFIPQKSVENMIFYGICLVYLLYGLAQASPVDQDHHQVQLNTVSAK